MSQVEEKRKIKEMLPKMKGEWFIHSFSTEKLDKGIISEEDFEKEIMKHYKEYQEGKRASAFPLWSKPKIVKRKNIVMDGLIDTIIKNMKEEKSGTDDLEVRYIAVGTNNRTTF